MLNSRLMEPTLTRPALGRRIALELRAARPLTWVGPIAATICGALAATGLNFSGEVLLRVAIAVLLTDPILGAWRAAWVNTDWRRPMRDWQATPTRSWMLVPYARLDSPAAHLSQWMSSRAKFWRQAIVPEVGQSISAIVVTGLIALSVALVLGTTTFILTFLTLFLAPLESELGANGAGRWARALAEVGMAWLIGHGAVSLAIPTLTSTGLAFLFAMTYRGLLSVPTRAELGFAISNLGQILIVILLIARGALISAGIVALGLVAQCLWQAVARRSEAGRAAYLTRVQWFILLAMLVAALGVPH